MAKLEESLTVRQAYLAMFEYLRQYYERGQSDEIGAMLGALSLLSDGGSVDPATLDDFLHSVDVVLQEEGKGGYSAISLELS